MHRVAGNALSLAYIPDFSFPYSDHMSFYERCSNAYSILRTLHLYYTQYLPGQQEWMRTYFKDPSMPPLVDMLHNVSLFFSNAHPHVHFAQPYTPNVIPIGGVHLSTEAKPLPQDIQKFMDEGDRGVIYFSLGSIVPDHLMSQEFFDNFIRVFRGLPQRVLWKTRSNLTSLPANVMTAHWIPQQDVLAHPNTAAFMTHGGLFSQHEAISNGVPVVCIPLFADQRMNARFYEEREIGVKLPFDSLSEENIYSALTTVLNNPSYKQNMGRLSRIYRDQPVAPADSAVFWVEYVLRHKGAPHLRPAAAHLQWYQLALLDVVATLLAVGAVILATLWWAAHSLLRVFTSSHKKITPDKKNS